MIVEQVLPGTLATANKTSDTLFYSRDAKIIAKTFIKFPDVVQVGVFGGVARYGISQTLGLALVVSDEQVFQKYMELISVYHSQANQLRDDREIRLAAFDQIWCRHNPTWHNCQTERRINLRQSLDLLVLPFDWQDRVDEIEPMLMSTTPDPLFSMVETVTFLETQV